MDKKLHKFIVTTSLILLAVAGLYQPLAAQEVPKPADFFGFEPGADYELIDYDQLEEYYRALAGASERVLLREIGETHRGNTLLMLIISSEENLANLEEYKNISRQLALAKNLSDEEARELSREGKAVVWLDSGLHSTELAHSQHNPVFAYQMATKETDEIRRMRDEVILLNMPLMNPDGHEIVVDWYRQHKDTEFALTEPPEVYHEYIGHDNNRDWYMMLQNESQAVNRILYKEWFPQIVVNHHQMGEMPPRMFIPPFANPVNPNIPAMAVRGTNLVGEHMGNRFVAEDKPGVIQGITFNMWWNGGMRTVPYFHNMVGILTESTHKSPVPREWEEEDIPEKITRGSNEIAMKEPSIFYPDPWEGGKSSLAQMVDYHLTASYGVMDIAMKRKQDWLYNIYQMGRQAIEDGQEKAPYAYVIPPEQWDRAEAVNLVEVLQKGGLEIHRASAAIEYNGEEYPEGSYVIYASQAFRPYLIDLMEPQYYPDRRLYPEGPPEPPYDMAGWTLPLQMGVNVGRINEQISMDTEAVEQIEPFKATVNGSGSGYLIPSTSNMSIVAVNRLLDQGVTVRRLMAPIAHDGDSLQAGAFYVEGQPQAQQILQEAAGEFGLAVSVLRSGGQPDVASTIVEKPRVGMYRSWTSPMDEGWTRWIFDNYEVDYETLRDEDIRAGNLGDYDIIVLPSMEASTILKGHEAGTMPEQYTGGLGVEGAYHLKKYAEGGGTLLGWEGATDFLIDQLGLPIENALRDVREEDFFIPGSLIKVRTDNRNPQAFGVEEEHAAFFLEGSAAYNIIEPAKAEDKEGQGPPVEVIARYGEEDLLLSGWSLGEEEYLGGKPAALRAGIGEGEVILIGFRPQLRAQSRATFKFLFNPIMNAATSDPLKIAEWGGKKGNSNK